MRENKIIFNKTLTKGRIRDIVNWFLVNYGSLRTKGLLDSIKRLGFKYSTLAGISIGIEDLNVPIIKDFLFSGTELYIRQIDLNFKKGKIPLIFFLEKSIQSWSTVSDVLV